jgi:hypothetical protein
MSDTLKQIADNLGVSTINGNYLSGIADYYGVDLATSTDLMRDILVEVGGNPATSTDYLQDIVLELGGTVINDNWMEGWEAITSGPPPAPVNSTLPVISGTTTIDSVLTSTNGTWTNSPTSYAYQWKRGATNIGTNANTYQLVLADSTAEITCVVTATNAGGSTPATSNTITADNYAPINTVAPVVTPLSFDVAVANDTLYTTDGSWENGYGGITYTYQWYRQPDLGGTNDPIIGATNNYYNLLDADADYLVSCEVTATADGGSATAPSNSLYVYNEDYYFNVYSWTNYTTEPQSHKQNRLMIDLKSSGVWAKLDLLYVFATDAANGAAAMVEWKSGFPNGTLMGTVSFNANQGFTLGGASYIETFFDPSTYGINYTLNNASRYFFPYYLDSGGPMDGTSSLRNSMTVFGNTADNYINQGTVPLAVPFAYTNTVEPKSIHRTSATDIKLYNGTTFENRTALSTALASDVQLIGSANGVVGEHIVSGYAMGASMVAENTAFIAAWNTYITSL